MHEQPIGDPIVALDAVDAGVGDRVLAVQAGFSAMTAVGHSEAPIDAAVIGVVDRVELA
jgi:microcompartment protein CcmK/EutM